MRLILLILIAPFLFSKSHAKTITITAPTGGDFALPSTQGFLTSRQLIGKQVFMFFGFSTCPEVCPLTLQTMKQVAQSLTPEERDHFRFLFISVDPEVDTLERLNALKSFYGEQYIGATHSHSELSQIASQFGAFFRISKTRSGKKIISHTDSIFHINRQGQWVNTIAYGTQTAELIEHLREAEERTQRPGNIAQEATLIAENSACDLATDDCLISVNGEHFTLALSPKPIRTERPLVIFFKTNTNRLIPEEIDFQGETLNMGYLRPVLKRTKERDFKTTLTLPVCELEKMNWIVKVLLKDSHQKLWALKYRLTTRN